MLLVLSSAPEGPSTETPLGACIHTCWSAGAKEHLRRTSWPRRSLGPDDSAVRWLGFGGACQLCECTEMPCALFPRYPTRQCGICALAVGSSRRGTALPRHRNSLLQGNSAQGSRLRQGRSLHLRILGSQLCRSHRDSLQTDQPAALALSTPWLLLFCPLGGQSC